MGIDLSVSRRPALRKTKFRKPKSVKSRRWRRLLVGATVASALGVEGAWVAPFVARAGPPLAHAQPFWLIAALVAQAISMLGFALLQRAIPHAAGLRVGLGEAVSTALAGNALSVSLPGGSVVSVAYTSRRMRAWGASRSLTAFALAASAALSTIGLIVVSLVAGLAVAGARCVTVGSTRDVVEVVVLATSIAAVTTVLRRPAVLRAAVARLLRAWARLRPAHAARAGVLFDTALAEMTALRPGRRVWTRGLVFALLNRGADVLCLLSSAYAVGASVPAGMVLFAYAAGITTAAVVPLLPGGVGPLDAALVVVLSRGGSATATAGAAVLVYRAISLVLVAAVGWAVLAFRKPKTASRTR